MNAPDVLFENVTFQYPGATNPILRQTDWQVEKSSFTLVAGLSGSGKSTLLRCLNGLVPHFSGGSFGGRLLVRHEDTRFLPTRLLARHVGFVFQDPEAHAVSATVADEIAFGMEQLSVPVPLMRRRVEEMLDLVGISPLRHRAISSLSGGERQRVSIAAALALQPRVLVLDEPTSQLDPWGAEDVLSAVRRLNEELGITVVLSEHRLERVAAFADQMRLMLDNAESLNGAPVDVLRICDVRICPPIVQAGRAFGWDPLPLTVNAARRKAGTMAIPLGIPSGDPARPNSSPTLQLQRVTLGYDDLLVLHDVNLDVRPQEIVSVMGRNGTGKSTLLRACIGLHKTESGQIIVGEQNIAATSPAELGRVVGFLPQRATTLFFAETVLEEIEFTIRSRGGEMVQERDRLLKTFGLEVLRDRNPLDLSTGEQERLALAVTVAGSPSLLLLDEPTRGMDALRKDQFVVEIRNLAEQGVAIIMASHDVELVAKVSTRIVLLGDREIIADGGPRSVLAGSLTFGTQINKVFGDGYLTPDDVLATSHRLLHNP